MDRADRNAATVWKASRIGCSLATDCANVNGFWSDAILTRASWICEAHPDQPWPHDDQTAPKGTCPGPGMQCNDPDCPWWQGASPAALDTSDFIIFSSTRDSRAPEK